MDLRGIEPRKYNFYKCSVYQLFCKALKTLHFICK